MTGSLGFKGPQSSSDHLIVHPLVLGHLLTILAHGAPAGALTPLAVVVSVDTYDRSSLKFNNHGKQSMRTLNEPSP